MYVTMHVVVITLLQEKPIGRF